MDGIPRCAARHLPPAASFPVVLPPGLSCSSERRIFRPRAPRRKKGVSRRQQEARTSTEWKRGAQPARQAARGPPALRRRRPGGGRFPSFSCFFRLVLFSDSAALPFDTDLPSAAASCTLAFDVRAGHLVYPGSPRLGKEPSSQCSRSRRNARSRLFFFSFFNSRQLTLPPPFPFSRLETLGIGAQERVTLISKNKTERDKTLHGSLCVSERDEKKNRERFAALVAFSSPKSFWLYGSAAAGRATRCWTQWQEQEQRRRPVFLFSVLFVFFAAM